MTAAGRWDEAFDPRPGLLEDLLPGSPDGLLHARPGDGSDPRIETLCVTGGDRELAGAATFVALNLGAPTADRSKVTCPDCCAWLHA